jgi:oligopeptidase B
MTMAIGAAAPSARRVPIERTFHGDTVIDEYSWLEDPLAPESVAFVEAQNAFTTEMIKGQEQLRETIFGEIRARTLETDVTVPARKGQWWYYTRTVQGKQYEIHCRQPFRAGESAPLVSQDRGLPDCEQVLLDANELAADHDYFSLGSFAVSPDGNKLAYSTDVTGSERFTVRILDLITGETGREEITGAFYGLAWSADGSVLFYVAVNDAWRPCQVWRHVLGTPVTQDAKVFEEADERFGVQVSLTRSERLIVITCQSKLTAEVWLVDALDPLSEPRVVAPRRQGVTYRVDHQIGRQGRDRLIILHNDGAQNFELATAPLSAMTSWTPMVKHREDTRLLGLQTFETYLAVSFRREALTGLRIIGTEDGACDHELAFDEPLYTVHPGINLDYRSHIFRLAYGSLATPDSIYDYDTTTGELTLRRQRPVLALPGGKEFGPADYEQHREWATSADGTAIPISIVQRRGTPRDGTAPLLLFGYGAYEISVDPTFANPRLSLLDRGVGFAIAHVRGGGELGRSWYHDGKQLNKQNSFSDFLACARHLVATSWTSADRLIARGASAGGLLVGASVNAAPEVFAGIVAQVPFVDALTTMLDPARPLTVPEWEEWGDPLHDPAAYACIKSYSPYENIRPAVYPPILVLASMQDARVPVSEAAKWIARLQAKALGGPFLLKTAAAAGHGGRSGRYDSWREEAAVLAWVIDVAGRPTSDDLAKGRILDD